jgi:hypothetical protein
MFPHQSDADAERLVERSAVFRAVRQVLRALDAASASSATARVIAKGLSRQSLGILLLAASVTHAAIITFVPPSSAPAGRYLFAIAGALVGALLLTRARAKER